MGISRFFKRNLLPKAEELARIAAGACAKYGAHQTAGRLYSRAILESTTEKAFQRNMECASVQYEAAAGKLHSRGRMLKAAEFYVKGVALANIGRGLSLLENAVHCFLESGHSTNGKTFAKIGLAQACENIFPAVLSQINAFMWIGWQDEALKIASAGTRISGRVEELLPNGKKLHMRFVNKMRQVLLSRTEKREACVSSELVIPKMHENGVILN